MDNEISTMLYADTNVLRYFSKAFRSSSIDPDLARHIVFAPLVLMELISQLDTPGAKEAFASIRAILSLVDPARVALLPWSEEVFRTAIYGLPPGNDDLTKKLNHNINICLAASGHEELREDARKIRALLIECKREVAGDFERLLVARRLENALTDEIDRNIFALAIARRAEVSSPSVSNDYVLEKLAAYYAMDKAKLEIAAAHPAYSIVKHQNDAFDAELLIYLADNRLHFLTSDKGYRRVNASPQANRVHIARMEQLTDPVQAQQVLREIICLH